MTPREPAAAALYAARILTDDDEFGARSGLVVQGDGVLWRGLDALELLARRGQAAHRDSDPHPPGVTALTCPLCAAVFALDVHLVDGLAAYRAAHRQQ